MTCGAFTPGGGYVVGLTSFVDCRVEELAHGGYLALAADGSPVRLVLTGLVTILVALIGYRMMLGSRVEIRDGVLTAVRLGIVLSLATQWPAYQALVYNVVIKGPAELTTALTAEAETPPEALPDRIETSYQALEALAHPRPSAPLVAAPSSGATVPPAQALAVSVGGGLTIEEQQRLSTGSIVLLVSSLGALMSVRIAAGLLLALGPLFAACLLFDGLRGWFEGWVRSLVGAALGSFAATAVLALELAVLEPQLSELLVSIRAGPPRPGAVTEVFATALLFAVVVAATIWLVVRAAAGFRLPSWSRPEAHIVERESKADAPAQARAVAGTDRTVTQMGRAQHVAEAVRLLDDRATSQERTSASTARLTVTASGNEATPDRVVPLGRTYRRNQPATRSASAGRRDQSS